jgi:hypothetical protein
MSLPRRHFVVGSSFNSHGDYWVEILPYLPLSWNCAPGLFLFQTAGSMLASMSFLSLNFDLTI